MKLLDKLSASCFEKIAALFVANVSALQGIIPLTCSPHTHHLFHKTNKRPHYGWFFVILTRIWNMEFGI